MAMSNIKGLCAQMVFTVLVEPVQVYGADLIFKLILWGDALYAFCSFHFLFQSNKSSWNWTDNGKGLKLMFEW